MKWVSSCDGYDEWIYDVLGKQLQRPLQINLDNDTAYVTNKKQAQWFLRRAEVILKSMEEMVNIWMQQYPLMISQHSCR